MVGLLLSLAYPDKRLKLVTCGIAAIAAVELMQVISPVGTPMFRISC
jgi:hypothetical protein